MRWYRVDIRQLLAAVAVTAAMLTWGGAAQAAMVVTAQGQAEGFSISTFADSFPNFGIGTVGIGFVPGGNVLVSDYNFGQLYSFPDVDGQHASASNRLPVTDGFNNYTGLTTIGSTVYMAEQGSGTVVTVNPTTGATTPLSGVFIPAATDILADPTTGLLYVSGLGNGIYKLDPVTHAVNHFSGVSADGISISPDGSTLYVANNGFQLLAVSTATGLVTRNYGVVSGIDGTALGTGSIAGKIYANTNFGQVIEIDLTTGLQTVIATGGSRGDLVKVDPNGTLLLTQTDSVLRLTAPEGGGFGGPAPEPASMTLFGLGALGLAGYGWRRRKTAVV